MSTPEKPEDHPPPEHGAPTHAHGHAPNGVPPPIDGDEAKGLPTSDRANTEEAAKNP